MSVSVASSDRYRAVHRNVVLLEMSPLLSNIRLARLVVSALGTELGLTVEEIDDLRIAVDEACFWLVSNDVVGLVGLRLETAGNELTICLTAELRDGPTSMPATAQQVLGAVTADWGLGGDGVGLEVRISPRRDGIGPG